jgi:hypothetical protein
MKNLFYFIATVLLLTACVDPIQEQIDLKSKEVESLGIKMEEITQKIHYIIDQKAEAETFVFRLEGAGASKNSKDYKNAVAEVARLSSMYDSLNVEADKIAVAVDKGIAQIDSLMSLQK